MISPSQTIGPFSAFCLTPADNNKSYRWLPLVGNVLAGAEVDGEHIKIEGRVLNGSGVPHKLTMLEFWQADAQGKYRPPDDDKVRLNSTFVGFGRCETDSDGRFTLSTIKPGGVPSINGLRQAPHIAVAIHSPMLLTQLCTRIYFEDDSSNAADAVLALVPVDRRNTLMAKKVRDSYHIDFITQGEHETVFFDY